MASRGAHRLGWWIVPLLGLLAASGVRAGDPARQPEPVARLVGCGGACVSFSRDGSRIATAGGAEARVWESLSGKPLTPPLSHGAAMHTALLTPDGTKLITAGDDPIARVWDVGTGKQLLALGHDKQIQSAAISADGSKLATGSSDTRAIVWDLTSGQKLAEFRHDVTVKFVAFSPAGDQLLTVTRRGGARWNDDTATEGVILWDLRTRRKIRQTFNAEPNTDQRHWLRPAGFSADGKMVASISHSWLACVWWLDPSWAVEENKKGHRLAHVVDTRA